MITIQAMRAIYARLQDGMSRKIFENRLLYSISGDLQYIQNIAMKKAAAYSLRYKTIPRSAVVERVKQSSLPVILYGAGMFGKFMAEQLGKSRVKFFWDRKELDQVYGIAVKRPGADYAGEFIVVSASALYIEDIVDTLRALGIGEEAILIPDPGDADDLEHQYFDEEIIKFSDHEVFVDAGSYNFGISKLLLKKCGTVQSIYAFEPDANHWESVSQGIQDCGFDPVVFLRKGLWSAEGSLSFESNLSLSHVSEQGGIAIPVTRLDQAVKEPVTFIKMDIEGSELEALKGAAGHITKDKLKLAICVYHKPEDILAIPEYLLSLVPEYRLYLRHYSFHENETVLYAVP